MPRNTRKQLVGKQQENGQQRELARKLREFEQRFRREQYAAREGVLRRVREPDARFDASLTEVGGCRSVL